jgi:hypothetical protein
MCHLIVQLIHEMYSPVFIVRKVRKHVNNFHKHWILFNHTEHTISTKYTKSFHSAYVIKNKHKRLLI